MNKVRLYGSMVHGMKKGMLFRYDLVGLISDRKLIVLLRHPTVKEAEKYNIADSKQAWWVIDQDGKVILYRSFLIYYKFRQSDS